MASLSEQSQLLNSVAMLGTGTLNIDVVTIPSGMSFPWMLPESLVLDYIEDVDTTTKIYQWEGGDVALYNLTEGGVEKANLVLIESVADPYRIGVFYTGEIKKYKVSLSDLKDIAVSENFDYMMNSVQYNNKNFIIPALDKLSHELVDLDR